MPGDDTRNRISPGNGAAPADAGAASPQILPPDKNAISDALNFLTEEERQAFEQWHETNGHRFATDFNLCGYPVPVLDYANWRLRRTEWAGGLPPDLRERIEGCVQLRQETRQEQFVLHGADLLIFHDTASDRSTGFVVILSPEALDRFMTLQFPNAKLTPALLRLMTCYLGGLSLTESSRRDGKSVETRKSQARELRQRLELERTEDIPRIVGARVMSVISSALTGRSGRGSETFDRYVSRYLPDATRSLVLLDRGHQPFRILDMGPKSGAPLIVLHAMILPDIRKQDIAMLHELGLRLIWPLRNGLNSPEDPQLSEEEQIRHACRGIEIVREIFCEECVSILSLAASSKIALAYARENRTAIDALYFAASCVLQGRPQGGVRRLAKGMLTLAGYSDALMSATMEYFQRTILNPKRFPEFIRNQFRDSAADGRIVEAELNGPFAGERFREALVTSITSARHDFGFQRALDWDIAPTLGVEMNFLHGDDDPIHPLPLIEDLAGALPDTRLHVIEGAGQLLYHQHLHSVLAPIAERLRA